MIMSVSECLNFLPMAIESDKMPSSSSSLTAMSPEQCWLCGHRLGSICWKNNDWTFPQHSTFSSSSDGQKCWTLWKKNFSNPFWHIWQKHYYKDDLDKDENDGLEKSITCHPWESEYDQSCLRLIWIRFHQSQSSEKGQNTNIVGENIASIIEPRMRMKMGDMDLCKIGGGGPALVYQVAERSWQRQGWKQFLVTMTIITMMMMMKIRRTQIGSVVGGFSRYHNDSPTSFSSSYFKPALSHPHPQRSSSPPRSISGHFDAGEVQRPRLDCNWMEHTILHLFLIILMVMVIVMVMTMAIIKMMVMMVMTNGCFTAQLNGTHIPAFIRVFDTVSHLSSQSSDKIIIIIEVPVTEIVHIKKMSKKHKSCANVALLEKCFNFQENLCAANLIHITMMMHIRWKSFILFPPVIFLFQVTDTLVFAISLPLIISCGLVSSDRSYFHKCSETLSIDDLIVT